jgi:hypothetical protein
MRDLADQDGPGRWIITDLVTLGCPLTYADALMATGPEDLADRFEERSLAAAPPVPQQVRRAAGHPYRFWVPAHGIGTGTTRWHHAAPFACVEWTNLWFEHDIVGGPVGAHFGPGVTDRSLGGSRWLAMFAFAYPHSSYWVASHNSRVRQGSLASLRFLRETVWRPPTLLLTARTPLTDQQVAEVTGLLGGGDPQRPPVDVRLYVGISDADRTGRFLPVGRVPLPTAFIAQRVREVLGRGSRLALLTSPDLLADTGPDVLAAVRSDPMDTGSPREEAEGDSLDLEAALPMTQQGKRMARRPDERHEGEPAGIREELRLGDQAEVEVDAAGEEE